MTKNWCFWTGVLEKTLESPLDCKETQPIHPKGNQSWLFIRRTDVEAATPILWPPDVKSWLIWKDPDAGKDWRREKKGTIEDGMVGWHHWLNGHWFGVGDRQGDLVCCSPWGYKGSDTTEWLNWTDLNWPSSLSSDLPEAVWTLAQPQEILACLSLMPLEILALWKTGKERLAVGFCEDSLPSFPMNPHCLVFSALFSTCWSPIILNEACLVDYLSCFFLTAVFELCL